MKSHNNKALTFILLILSIMAQSNLIQADIQPAPLKVIGIAEGTFDDQPALEISLSSPLDPTKRYHSFFEVYNNQQKVSGSWILSDDASKLYFPNIHPENTYDITVLAGLKSEKGHLFTQNESFKISTVNMAPAFGFMSNGSILPKKLSGGLPIMTVNVDNIDIQFLRVKKERLTAFLNRYPLQSTTYIYDLSRINQYTEVAFSGQFGIKDKTKNKRIMSQIQVSHIDELSKSGMYVAVMTRPGHFTYQPKTAYFFISDIGIHTRKYKDTIDIYTSSLETGESKNNVSIEIFDSKNRKIANAKTNNSGFVSLENSNSTFPARILIAQKNGEISFLKLNSAALDLSEYNISGRPQNKLESFIYSSRDLYRPGETAEISVLLKDHDGKNIAGQPVIIEIIKPNGNVHKKFTQIPSDMGYIHNSVWIPDDAPTGKWKVQVKTNPNSNRYIASYKLNIEEFHPERIKVELATDEKELLLTDPLEVNILANYLYGAPASNNRITTVLNIRRNKHPVETFKQFTFGSTTDNQVTIRKELADSKLDKEGRTKLTIPPIENKLSSPMSFRVTASVYESGGRAVSRSLTKTMWPADSLIGIKPLFDSYASADEPIKFEVIKSNRQGDLKVAANLQIKIIHEDRKYHWFYDENSGWNSEYTQVDYDYHSAKTTINDKAATVITIPKAEYGLYRLEIFDPQTKLTAKYRYRVGWYGGNSNASTPNKVKLSLDKESYYPGEKAKLKIVPPHAGNGIIIIESNQRLWNKRITVPKEGGTFEIPVDESWDTHNIYISTIIFRSGDDIKKITPNRAIGLIHLPLNRATRKLDLSITAPEKIQPNTNLDISVNIDNYRGQKAHVTIAAVDLGILNITNFKTPDPHKYFFEKRRYDIDSIDIYNKVIELIDSDYTYIKFGGDADSSGKRKNKLPNAKIQLVSLFSGIVDVDKDGKANISFPIPDFNGRVRIMAVAFDANNFGSVEQDVTIAAPIVAEISTPRFITNNDVSLTALDIQNLSGKDQTIQLALSTTKPLKQRNETHELTLKDKEKTTIHFEIETDNDFGIGKINMDLKSEELSFNKSWELAIKPAYPNIEFTKTRTINAGEKLDLNAEWINKLMPKTVAINVSASLMPPLDLKNTVNGLFGYPYGCLEQTSSRAFPNIYIENNIAKQIGIKPISLAERNKRFDRAISRLGGMQLSNGGFGLWGKSSPEEPWLTPFVTDFLIQAKQQGFTVPENMLSKALNNLEKRVRNSSSFNFRNSYTQDNLHLHFASNAYAAYVLAQVQKAPLSSLRNMYEFNAKQAKSGLPLVQLGIALILQGDKRKGLKAIKEGLEIKRSEKYLGDYGSNIRDDAFMLALLHQHNINIKNKLIFSIRDNMINRRYLSTQERIAIFRAGYHLLQNNNNPLIIGVHQDLVEERFETNSIFQKSFSVADIKAGTHLEFITDKPIYTAVTISGFPKEPPAPRTDKIEVVRSYFTMDGKPVSKRMFKTGEMMLARLNVRSSIYINDAMIVDLLPAGFEIENLNISQGENMNNIRIHGVSPAQAMSNGNIKHIEYRDDRFVAAVFLTPHNNVDLFYLVRVVSPGTFNVPATFAEDMYRPDIRSIGVPQKTITVSNPDN